MGNIFTYRIGDKLWKDGGQLKNCMIKDTHLYSVREDLDIELRNILVRYSNKRRLGGLLSGVSLGFSYEVLCPVKAVW